jgi:hypothetical protein
MPSVQTQTATPVGAGTFSTAVVPPLNMPITVAAGGSVSVTGSGYLIALITDSISGQIVCGITDMIRPSEILSGVKSFNISISNIFAQAANLQVSISTRPLDGAPLSAAPILGASSLSAFSASATAQQGTV